MAQVPYETAYPRVEILPSSRNWWAKLKGTAAECIHTRDECAWIAALLPDTLYLRGKRAPQPRAGAAGNFALPRMSARYHPWRVGRIRRPRCGIRAESRSLHSVFFRGHAGFRSSRSGARNCIGDRATARASRRNLRGMLAACRLGYGCREKMWLVSMKQIRYAESAANGFAPRTGRENWRTRSRESPRPMCST